MGKIQTQIFLLTLVLSGIVIASASDEEVLGIPIALRADDLPPTCNGFYGVRCADCSRLQICLGDTQVALHNCGDLNPNAPYCTDRACSAAPTDVCRGQLPSSSFACTDAGLFPNTNNCSRYFLCSEAGAVPKEYECPSPFVYSSKDGACKRRVYANDCVTLDCSRSPGRFLVYSADRSILAYCERNAEFPVLTRCPDSVNQEYDANTLQCQFVCRSEGRFADRLDCRRYYQCLRNGFAFVQIHGNCSPLIYNRATGQCVRGPSEGCENEITTSTALPPPSSDSTSTTSPSTTASSGSSASTTSSSSSPSS